MKTLSISDHARMRFNERYRKAASNLKNLRELITLLSTPGKYKTINIQGDIHTRSTRYEITYTVRDKASDIKKILKEQQEFHAIIDVRFNYIKTFLPILNVDNSKYQIYDYEQLITYKNEQIASLQNEIKELNIMRYACKVLKAQLENYTKDYWKLHFKLYNSGFFKRLKYIITGKI